MQEQQAAAHDVYSSVSTVQLGAAETALQQLADWRLQHRDHMRADVMQVIEESSDDESTLAEGSQVNMTANASSFGTFADGCDNHQVVQPDIKNNQQQQPVKVQRRGLVGLIKNALRRW